MPAKIIIIAFCKHLRNMSGGCAFCFGNFKIQATKRTSVPLFTGMHQIMKKLLHVIDAKTIYYVYILIRKICSKTVLYVDRLAVDLHALLLTTFSSDLRFASQSHPHVKDRANLGLIINLLRLHCPHQSHQQSCQVDLGKNPYQDHKKSQDSLK